MTILEKIIAAKKLEVERARQSCPTRMLERSSFFSTASKSLSDALLTTEQMGIIAEIKRKSPSKGVFKEEIDVVELSVGYRKAGASALSILTDQNFFGGSNDDLRLARQHNEDCPVLRKDFVVSEYQVIEAKSIGADAVLLLANVLTAKDIKKFADLARSLTMEVLLEVHNGEELDSCFCDAVRLVGVNNRNLKDFTVDLENSFKMASLIPDSLVKVAESGLGDSTTIVALREAGYRGFLIGETFMKHDNPAQACAELVELLRASISRT